MSNNKQTMKLYTEEQVRKAIELSRDTHQEGRAYMERDEYDYSMDEVVDLLTPIELPTIKEIQKEADMFYRLESYNITFVRGARLVLDKIQEGNNEQQ